MEQNRTSGPARARRLLSITLAALIGASIPATSIAADPPSHTGAFLWGDTNSEFLKNSFRTLAPTTYTFVDYASNSERVWLRATPSDPGMQWNFVFAAPPGVALTTGRYTGARNAIAPRSAGVPGIYLSGEGGSCSDNRGLFEIVELVRDAQGNLVRFAAVFDHSCADSASNGFDRGEIRFQSTIGWAGWTISTAPFSAFAFGSTAVGQTSQAKEVLVTNPSTDSVFVNPHFIGANAADFAFSNSTHCLGELPAGAQCRFGVVFAPKAAGNRTAQLKVGTDVRSTYKLVDLTGTATPGPASAQLTISANPNPAYVSDTVTFTVTADPKPDGGTISLYHGDSGDRIVNLIGTKPVGGSNGSSVTFTKSFASNEGLQLKAVFSGTSTLVGSESPVFARGQIEPPNSWFDQVPNTWEAQETGYFRFRSINNTNYWQPAVRFECKLDGSAWSTCVSPHTTAPLGDGEHTFGVRGIDANGRTELFPEYRTWNIDTKAPTVSAVFNNGIAYTNKNVIPVHFDATDASPLGVDYMAVCGTSQVTTLGNVDCPAGAGGFHADWNYDLTRASFNNTPGEGVKTIYYNVADQWNHWSPVQSATITYDTTAPGGVAPTIGISRGRFSSKVPVTLSWPVASDNLSGIGAYRLQRKVNAGSMVTLNGSTPLALSYADQLTAGTKYGYQMRALDRADNGGAWSTPFYCVPVVQQNGGTASVKTGKWLSTSVSDSSGGTVLRTTKGGSSISTTFTGRSFAWVSTMSPTMGQARIYVDGATQPVATVDLYAASRTTRQIVWSTNFASGGTHKIKIVAVGTTGRPAVDVDAFLVLRNP